MSGIMDFLFGSKDKFKKLSSFSPEQEDALRKYFEEGIETSDLYGAGSNFLTKLLSGGPEAYRDFEQPYLTQFQQQIAPGIAERFAGMGTGAGASSSSALNQALAQAGGNLSQQLASLRGNMQLQSLPQALGYAQQPYSNTLGGLGLKSFENVYQPGSQGFLPNIAGSAMGGLSSGLGMGFGKQIGSLLK